MNTKVVYFAGKVSKNGGYRGKLLNDPLVMSMGHKKYEVSGGSVVYGGPFALMCDHGCRHMDGMHGLLRPIHCWDVGRAEDLLECEHGYVEGLRKDDAVNRCLEQIQSCDAVHVYLDTISCYGTLSEIGYANAFAKPIYIYLKQNAQNWDKHFWFVLNMPSVKHCGYGDETSIHPDLVSSPKSYKERYHEYLQSNDWKQLRQLKLFEAKGRCQLCNSPKKPLNVHHRTYDRVFNELPEDLIVLCEQCHKKFHDIKVA